MRAGELAGLRVRNINFDKLTIQVDETVEDLNGHLRPGTTKTRKSKGRRIPVPSAVMAEVAAYVESVGLARDYYVFAVPGKLFSHANFYTRQWTPACTAAGLAGTRFHTLRHTFITLRAREGVPVHLLMAWAGHSNISTTMISTHVFEDDNNDHEVAERIFNAQRRETRKPEVRLVEGEAV